MSAKLLCSMTGATIHIWQAPQVHPAIPINVVPVCGTLVKRGVLLSATEIRGGDYTRCEACYDGLDNGDYGRLRLDAAFPTKKGAQRADV
jgi:hypothetical protein